MEWETQKVTVMEEIIQAKAEQVSTFRDKLDSSNSKTTFAEATFAVYWGTGLDITGTTGTNPLKRPGENKLGFVVNKVAALVSGRRLRSVSVPMKYHHSDQDYQTNIDKFISDIRKEKGKKYENVHRVNDPYNKNKLTYHGHLTPNFLYIKCQRFKHL